MRFDELELATIPSAEPESMEDRAIPGSELSAAPRFKRLFALLTDLSLFVAISLALSPLLPLDRSWLATAALTGFVIILSYYYFVGSWLLWGKTIGAAIFDVRIISGEGQAMTLKAATFRWLGVYCAVLTGGAGFALALLPSRQSLPDRLSATHCVVSG